MSLHNLLDQNDYADWDFLGSTTNYETEIVTETWRDTKGNRVTLYRKYGYTAGKRYRECHAE